jgi:predicted metal-dependent hydrolase
MNLEKLWNSAVKEHNSGDYHEAHELFEDLWLELDERREKDTVQYLAQADSLAVHINTGNIRAALRLMRQLPELVQTFPSSYNGLALREMSGPVLVAVSLISGQPVYSQY